VKKWYGAWPADGMRLLGCGLQTGLAGSLLYFFLSPFSILLFSNSMLEFESVLNDMEHMNLPKFFYVIY
jgi:hypothetical protein